MNFYILFFIFQFVAKAFILILPLLLFILVRYLYRFVTITNKSVYQFQILSFTKNIIIVSLYVFVFGLLFNFLRLYASYKILVKGLDIDLKPLLKNILMEFTELYKKNQLFFFYVIVLIILVVVIIILFWRSIHQYSRNELFSLYLYLVGTIQPVPGTMQDLGELREEREKSNPRLFYYVRKIHYKYGWYAGQCYGLDIIRAMIFNFVMYLSTVYWDYYNIPWGDLKNIVPRLLYEFRYVLSSKWLNRLLFLSPLLFLTYDCLLNDLVINNTIIWMTVYVPLFQLYRLGVFEQYSLFCVLSLLYDILYGNDKYTYIAHEKLKPILELAIMNKCEYIDILTVAQNYDFDPLAYTFLFEYDYDRDIYINGSGLELRKKSETIFVEIDDETTKWVYVAGNKEGYNPNRKITSKSQ